MKSDIVCCSPDFKVDVRFGLQPVLTLTGLLYITSYCRAYFAVLYVTVP